MPSGLLRPPRLRPAEEAGRERHESWFDLFFDLVFVVAVAQLAHDLAADPSAAGFLRFGALFVPVWWTWIVYLWYADRFDTDDAVYRLLMTVGMFTILALAATLPGIGGAGDARFVGAYLAVRAVPLALYARAARHVPVARNIIRAYGTLTSVATALLLGSLATPPPARYGLWATAVAIELAGPFWNWRTVRATPMSASHIPERLGLFTIIVLGESVVQVATGLGHVAWEGASVLIAAATFFVAVCLWWLYFDFVDPAWIALGFRVRQIYTYGHLPIAVGVTAVGVGAQLAIAQAAAPDLSAGARWALGGGTALFLLTTTAIRLAGTGLASIEWRRYRPTATVIGIVLAPAAWGGRLPPLGVVTILLTALVGLVAWKVGRQLAVGGLAPASSAAEPRGGPASRPTP